MPILNKSIQATYRILVSRSNYRPKAELYRFGLQEPIPPFQLPFRQGDTEPLIDLQALLHRVYDRAQGLIWRSTRAAPVPSLSESNAAWTEALLQQQDFR